MTQQFKFGDRVKCQFLGECVVINSSEHFCYVMNEKGNYNTIANPEHLELVPHPDTVRLDYIQNRLPEIRLVECNEAGAVAFCLTRKSGFVCTNTLSPSIRETIDNAMQ